MTLKEVAERIMEIRKEREVLANQDKVLGEELEELKASLLARFEEEGLSSVTCQAGRLTKTTRTVVKLQENGFEKFWEFAKENNASFLIQRRPAMLACLEYEKVHGVKIPGTETMTITDVSLTKAGK